MKGGERGPNTGKSRKKSKGEHAQQLLQGGGLTHGAAQPLRLSEGMCVREGGEGPRLAGQPCCAAGVASPGSDAQTATGPSAVLQGWPPLLW